MAGRRRTNRESRAFKAKIAQMKKKGKADVEIARELGVTRQYVSQVLLQKGLAGRRNPSRPVKPKAVSAGVISVIGRLEQEGESVLAEKLRTILNRRKVKKVSGDRKRER